MTEPRTGRVNALAFAILDANGDTAQLAERMRFFTDLTDTDVDRAMALAHWVKSTGGPQLVQQVIRPLYVVDRPGCVSSAEAACPA